MFIARIVFFRLHESPRYLVHAGRPHEAIESLQLISKFNGSELSLGLDDIEDTVQPAASEQTGPNGPARQPNSEAVSEAEQGSSPLRDSPPTTAQYSSIGQPDVALDSHSFGTPLPHTASTTYVNNLFPPALQTSAIPAGEEARPIPRPRMPSSSSRRMSRRLSTASSYIESKSRPVCRVLPRWMRRSALAWIDRVAMVLSPEWFRTTVLVWATWCFMSLGKQCRNTEVGMKMTLTMHYSVYNVQRILAETPRDALPFKRSWRSSEDVGRQSMGRGDLLARRMPRSHSKLSRL